MTSSDLPHASLGLGWDPGWSHAFAEHATAGRRPARVVAIHKETSIVRDAAVGRDRSAIVSGRFRHAAIVASDFPAVGDWVALEPTAPETGPDDPAVIAAVVPRRTAFRRAASDGSPSLSKRWSASVSRSSAVFASPRCQATVPPSESARGITSSWPCFSAACVSRRTFLLPGKSSAWSSSLAQGFR